MNRFDYATTLLIIAALFAVMSAVSVIRGRNIKTGLKTNVTVAVLLGFAASLAFGVVNLVR